MSVPDSHTTRPTGSRQRWSKFRALNPIAQIALVLLMWPLVALYLLPWERMWSWYRQLPVRQQQVTAVVGVGVLVALVAIGGITSENKKNTSEQASPSTETTTTTTQDVPVPVPSDTGTTVANLAPPIADTPPPEEPPAPATRYLGAREDDAVADADGRVEVRGLTTTVGPLRRVYEPMFGPRLCADLTLNNFSSDSQWYYADIEMSIQYPSGNEKGSVLVYDNNIGSGNLAPGGFTSGQVCFVDREEAGDHVVLWNRKEASLTTPRRGVWVYQA